MYYGENFYIFGSKDENKLDAIYSSVDGISWREPQRKFLLHKDMTDITAPIPLLQTALIYGLSSAETEQMLPFGADILTS